MTIGEGVAWFMGGVCLFMVYTYGFIRGHRKGRIRTYNEFAFKAAELEAVSALRNKEMVSLAASYQQAKEANAAYLVWLEQDRQRWQDEAFDWQKAFSNERKRSGSTN